MKFSKQREMILKEVISSNRHLTADNIYENLKKENPNLSLGTVYRNLTQLEEHGFIKKVNIPGDPVRFDGNLEEHDHFICEKCGDIIDIKFDSFKYESEFLDNNVKVNSSYIILKGICSKCNR
ncbi:Fur family transcriptional regulator [Peptostreptococcus canis]|uniref:Transcriptional repressor n=1 Tax=Peptostreptococcus canis TaxID=1159213 RepID=A0ABR6TJN7_9FIRM|nr:transcriptional repressor [Peptostreptococcus canis]MBC2575614.1 transcriptional repressor [Peptostreptococcus canis]MBP1997182.1 Fur family peroxide stress response transcriptional regulator [Peptostreptococcus canis]